MRSRLNFLVIQLFLRQQKRYNLIFHSCSDHLHFLHHDHLAFTDYIFWCSFRKLLKRALILQRDDNVKHNLKSQLLTDFSFVHVMNRLYAPRWDYRVQVKDVYTFLSSEFNLDQPVYLLNTYSDLMSMSYACFFVTIVVLTTLHPFQLSSSLCVQDIEFPPYHGDGIYLYFFIYQQ